MPASQSLSVRHRCAFITCASSVAILLGLAGPLGAAVIWDEAGNGDLSNDRLNPTALNLGVGVNSIIATSVQGDREYVALTVAPGTQLVAINLISYEGIDETAFIGVQAGGQLTEPPTGTNVENLLGWTHFGPFHIGLDILDDLGQGADAIGFTPPLGEGVYTFWMQQTGVNAATYQFDFVVDVPAPPAFALLALGLCGTSRRRKESWAAACGSRPRQPPVRG